MLNAFTSSGTSPTSVGRNSLLYSSFFSYSTFECQPKTRNSTTRYDRGLLTISQAIIGSGTIRSMTVEVSSRRLESIPIHRSTQISHYLFEKYDYSPDLTIAVVNIGAGRRRRRSELIRNRPSLYPQYYSQPKINIELLGYLKDISPVSSRLPPFKTITSQKNITNRFVTHGLRLYDCRSSCDEVNIRRKISHE